MLPGFGAQTVSPFPNPPEYASAYTSDRINNGSAPPPPHPLTEFKVYGEEYRLEDDVIAPLKNAGVAELYKNKNNWKTEMKKLNRSAIVAFFDLVEILIRAPDHPMREEKMVDLHTIFINMHHLINEFRPVQARDSVRILQERQIEELSDICKDFKKYLRDGREVVDDQFQMIRGKLPAPPQPSELTRVKLQDGVLHMLQETEASDDVEMKEEEGSEYSKKKARLELLSREDGPPSVVHLLARQFHDISLKK
ncbi:Mediator of RNA polymerase II transcription subunit 7 [Caenorhabditis elegans]|uniref:Mediator of RNA polymerase II transcription subunit 7 n=1 Tax=Caenorhabditis elegans TaxID=6239 RepID=MED7_CAEEL|nr:Mediator of RNA polymerase II transcription subunit 7 [Caenorhabditis elegans]Q95Q17.1 RecName: Full=Mediator of RNA polymerase II transcription subunit 7; AltName: Full=CeMED7; Short=MED-7; AltName: Full=Lethal protein 49; AltName: Full=Mediator complex subunit 7 [Caenorhabditis elegans]CAC42382.1 Mediator of RNA polymerase II transcription subunit 7 [Caenorhabditis elegans]|eukprot:NP_493586.1 Mediator of RNA polymerase II transcription subunit 7 [Caenorhabditis elegans]